MSINPMSMGISTNYSVSGVAAGRVQTAQAEQASPAVSGDSVQLGHGDDGLSPSPAAAQFSPASLAAETSASPSSASASSQPQIRDEAQPSASSSSDSAKSAKTEDSFGGADIWHIAGESSSSEDTAALAKTVDGGFEKARIALGTDGDDTITVTMNESGNLVVTVNDEQSEFSPRDPNGMLLVIDGGKGNDTIIVDKKVTVPLRLTGGQGDDTIVGGSGNDIIIDNYGSNKIDGGAGDDIIIAHGLDLPANGQGSTINGGTGRDYIEGSNAKDILSGGDGYDVIYGLGGDDEIHGGAGNDYLDGGEGDDTISGDEGNDNLVGGKGNDILSGGAGDDLLIGASGHDTMSGDAGRDRVISNGSGDQIASDSDDAPVQTIASMEVPANFEAQGDDIERTRIESDLETLAHTEHGQMMFSEIAATGHQVTIGQDTENEGSYCASGGGRSDPGVGSDSHINYSTTKVALRSNTPWAERAPIVSMYHEMCHSYNAAVGDMDTKFYDASGRQVSGWSEGTKGVEYQAMGVDNPSVKPNPHLLTENGLRELFGHVHRDRY
ncbi:MAG: M91 family zinc metallopeptidase [bacterium]|nr:M91 family zinc metallopeptidase [bacterium]